MKTNGDSISRPLFDRINARQIARTLLSRKPEEKEDLLEELLLWPPDLFGFTSYIFSITGAYHMVISPPNNSEFALKRDPNNASPARWPPYEGWSKKVRKLGLEWRSKLAGHIVINRSSSVTIPGAFTEKALRECKSGSLTKTRKALIHARVGKLTNGNSLVPGEWVPAEVRECFWRLSKRMRPGDQVDELFRDWHSLELLMTLHAIVDEACVGWGIREIPLVKTTGGFKTDPSYEEKIRKREIKPDEVKIGEADPGELVQSEAARFASDLLQQLGTLATFDPFQCRVLPKRHTPKVGITLRSMSSNLAFHRSSVDVKWKVPDDNILTNRLMQPENKIFSVLLLPWPDRVSATDFKAVARNARLGMPDEFGLFRYTPPRPSDAVFEAELRATLASAQQETPEIDIVVLPECALDEDQIPLFERIIGDEKFNVSAYVAGVRGLGKNPDDDVFIDNMVYFKMGDAKKRGARRTIYHPGEEIEDDSLGRTGEHLSCHGRRDEESTQYKHHRWKIDKYQIQNYNLGHALSPYKHWWESIKIRRRKVTFINVGNELTLCPLICEDLSRQDPIADLIRTVGPSLVITILMDGPQKKERWSARYASVLSEDPGCAVITLTSAGMVDRWTHPSGPAPRAVALWNDGQGSEREILLEKGASGILLSLSIASEREISADGREEGYPTNRIILGGIHQVFK